MITIYRVKIPPMSTIGYGYGKDENGKEVQFVGDHRPMRYIGEIIAEAKSKKDLPKTELEDWQLI